MSKNNIKSQIHEAITEWLLKALFIALVLTVLLLASLFFVDAYFVYNDLKEYLAQEHSCSTTQYYDPITREFQWKETTQ